MNLVAIILLSAVGGILRSVFTPLGVIGTLCVNLLGSFGLGLFYGLLAKKNMPAWVQSGMAAGLIGSFTTFSAFASDAETLMMTDLWMAIVYVVCSVAGGMTFSAVGAQFARVLLQVKSNEDEQNSGEERGAFAEFARYQTKAKATGD